MGYRFLKHTQDRKKAVPIKGQPIKQLLAALVFSDRYRTKKIVLQR